MPNPIPKLFLSYASADEKLASSLKRYLETHIDGLSVFMAKQSIQHGAEWQRSLHANLNESFVFVPIITEEWQNSDWCFGEWIAASVLGKLIYPFVETTAKLRPELKQLHYQSFSKRRPIFKDLKVSIEENFSQHRAKNDFTKSPFPYAFRYEPEDADKFRGRDKEVDKIVTQLNSMRHSHDGGALLLHGSSGAGKSSLVRAGVYPKLASNPKIWVVVSLFKTASHPFDKLLEALSSSLAMAGVDEQSLRPAIEALRNPSKTNFKDEWEQIAGLLGGRALVLIVDNLWRYFTHDIQQSERLLMLLGSAIQAQAVNVIGVLRSDQLHRVTEVLNISSSDYDTMWVVPSDPRVLMSSFNELLSEEGYVFDPDLIHTIYADMGAAMEAWPLIGRYLNNLWILATDKRTAFRLRNYERSGRIARQIKDDLATIEAALGRESDNFFDFLALEGISHAEGDSVLTRPIPRARIQREHERAIQLLEEKYLFVADVNSVTGEAVTEIVRAVIKYWDESLSERMQDGIVDRVNTTEDVREARRTAQQWRLKDRHSEWLVHRGNRLVRIRELLERKRLMDSELGAYLEECDKHFR